MRRRFFYATVVAAMLWAPWANAQTTDPRVKIGILTDMSGLNADLGGTGSVAAAQMAIEEVGGKVLGRPVELVSADMQSKPDVATAIAQKWYENDGVDLIADINNSTAAVAINHLAAKYKKINIVNQAATTRLTGSDCTPYSLHYGWDLYMLSAGTTKALIRQGAKKWFLIVVDYTFGHDMQDTVRKLVEGEGGRVVGVVRHPKDTADFSSYILQAQSSGADVVALINSGQDFKSSLKQAQEFGLTKAGQRVAGMVVVLTDIDALGLETAKGLIFTSSFYWDRTDETRAWSERFQKRTGRMPTDIQVSVYSGVLHYLKAVEAAGTKQSETVMAKMKSTPVNDVYAKGGIVRADGLLEHEVYLVQVKTPAESKGRWDYLKVVASLPGKDAFLPANRCAFAK